MCPYQKPWGKHYWKIRQSILEKISSFGSMRNQILGKCSNFSSMLRENCSSGSIRLKSLGKRSKSIIRKYSSFWFQKTNILADYSNFRSIGKILAKIIVLFQWEPTSWGSSGICHAHAKFWEALQFGARANLWNPTQFWAGPRIFLNGNCIANLA